MSLQFDPEFVADQVVILEAGLQKMGERFLETSEKIGLLNSVLSDKNAQLRSKPDLKYYIKIDHHHLHHLNCFILVVNFSLMHERITSLASLPSSLNTITDKSAAVFDGAIVRSSPLVSAVLISIIINIATFAVLLYQE